LNNVGADRRSLIFKGRSARASGRSSLELGFAGDLAGMSRMMPPSRLRSRRNCRGGGIRRSTFDLQTVLRT
jgi:hypothetical protein